MNLKGTPRSFARRVACVAAIAVLSTIAAGATWIVDANNGPGTHFTTIAAAVAAAAPGDVIVVRPAVYSELVTINKGVTIVGWNATTYPMTLPNPVVDSLSGGILITAIPPGQRCILSGIVITRPSPSGGYSLGIVNALGVVVLDRVVIPNGGVWIENSTDVFVEGLYIRHQTGAIPPTPAMTVVNSWVQANDLNATGGDLGGEPDFHPAGAPALEVYSNSIVALARPKLLGGFGGGPWITSASSPAGGPAIRCVSSVVAIVESLGGTGFLAGGQGGHRGVGSSLVIPSGNGGNGVEVSSSGMVVNKLPMLVVGGAAGPNLSGGPTGVAGLAAATLTGGIYAPVFDVPATFRNISATTSNGFWILSHHAAAPAYPVALAVMLTHDLFVYPPSVQFAGGDPNTWIALALGTANAAGYFELGIGLPPNIPIELAGTTLVVQTADDVVNTLFLANPTTWLLGF
jgi:hypothetical protein